MQSSSSLIPNGFEFVGFDACLMGTVETAAMLVPYAKYLIASQELEPGYGWDYTSIGACLDDDPDADGLTLSSAICDGFFAGCVEIEQGNTATLAVTDLARIGDLRTAFDAYAKDLYDIIDQGKDFAPIVRAINNVDNFGGNNETEGYTNMVDMGGLIAAGRQWSENADAAWNSLINAVKYEVKGPDHKYSTGLSMYYPLQIQGSDELSIFKDVCISAYYLGIVDKVAYGYANGGNMDTYAEDSSFPDLLDLWAQSGGDDMNEFFSAADWSYLDDMETTQSSAITFTELPNVDDNPKVWTQTFISCLMTGIISASVPLLMSLVTGIPASSRMILTVPGSLCPTGSPCVSILSASVTVTIFTHHPFVSMMNRPTCVSPGTMTISSS